MRDCMTGGRRLFLLMFTIACSLALVVVACGDDGPPDTSNNGGNGAGGNIGNGGESVGGFDGPTGNGGTTTGMGGEGGMGTLTYMWANAFGGVAAVTPQSVAVDNAGNIIVVGAFTGASVNFGGIDLNNAGGTDAFVLKLDASGDHVWSLAFGSNNNDGALGVTTDAANNILVTGPFYGTMSIAGGPAIVAAGIGMFPDVFVAKLDPNGAHLFSASYGIDAGNDDSGNAIATNPSSDMIVSGRFGTSIAFGGPVVNATGPGDRSMFLARLGPAGNHLYSQGFGDAANQEGTAVAGGPSGEMAVGGYTEGDINFGGGNLPNAAAAQRAVFAKLDSAGSHVFSRLLDSSGDARVRGLSFFDNGDLSVVGNFKLGIDLGGGVLNGNGGADDFFIGRYAADGTLIYGKRFGDQGKDAAAAAVVDGQDFVFVAGTFTGDLPLSSSTVLTSTGTAQDGFLVRVSPTGVGYAGVHTNGDNNAQGAGVAVDPGDGSVVFIGAFTGTIDLGGGPLSGSADIFVSKFMP